MVRLGISDRVKWIILLAGMTCVALGWYQTYPLPAPMPGQYAIDKISLLVWPGLSLVFAALYLISRSAGKRTQFACAVLFSFFAYVYYLFFPLLPGSDDTYFRALTKLFSTVGVDPTVQQYFQWPSFFILNNALCYVLGLDVERVSILVFLVTGVLLSSSLFIFFSKEDKRLGFVGVALYFVGLHWFINYQFAPQSVALALFFVLVNFTLRKTPDAEYWVCSFIVFCGVVTMHAFIAPLFLLYYFFLVVRDRTRLYSMICFSLIYVGYLVFIAFTHFTNLLHYTLYLAFQEHGEYLTIVQSTFSAPVTIWDGLAQMFSRGLTLFVWGMLGTGFLIRLLKRDIKIASLSMLLTGVVHLSIGTFTPVLGARSVQVLFVPIASGYKTFLSLNKKVVGLCLVLVLVLFPLVIVHEIYDAGSPLTFPLETISGQRLSDMLVKTIRTQGVVGTRLFSANHDGTYVTYSLPSGFDLRSVTPYSSQTSGTSLAAEYDYVIYSPLLEKELSYSGLNLLQIRNLKMQLITKCNRVLDDGYSVLLSCD
jgi:hypothetical protein